jgi:O-antigen/teichoic acid export membrane protein
MFVPKRYSERFNEFVKAHPKSKKVIKGFTYLVSEKMLKFVVGFFVHAMVARHLGPDHFGKLSYAIKTVNIFYTFSIFGVDEIILSELIGHRYARSDVLKTVFRIRIFMSLIGIFFLGILLLVFKPEGLMFSLLIFCYGINILLQAFNIFELDFQARLSFKPLFFANNLSYLSSSALRFLGVWTHQAISFFLASYIVGELILKSLIQKKAGFQFLKGSYNSDFASDLVKTSWPFFISSFVVILDQRLSFLFLEKYRTLEELGNYSVAVTLVDLWLFLPIAVTSSVFPTIITALNGNLQAYKVRKQYLYDIVMWLAFGFILGVALTADLVIKILYGKEYANAPEALAIYSLTVIPIFFNLVRVKLLSLEKRLNDWLVLSILCLVINFLFHYFFVPQMGVRGAIFAYLSSQLLGNFFLIFRQVIRESLMSLIKTLAFPFRLLK